MRVAEEGNRYAHTKEPWKRYQEDSQEAGRSLFFLLHVIYSLSILMHPFLPKTSRSLQGFFDFPLISGGVGEGEGDRWRVPEQPSSYRVSGVSPLFSKIEPAMADELSAKLQKNP